MSTSQGFRESNLFGAPIRDLGLKIEGTRSEPVIAEFRAELGAAGIKVVPRFYLSTEWGVPFGTVVDRHPVLSGPARADRRCTPSRSATSRASAAPTSCATCGTRWATSSTTPTSCTTTRSG